MPAKLDRCVKEVRAKLIKDGIPADKAESRAYAICRTSLKLETDYDYVEDFKQQSIKLINSLFEEEK